MNAEPGMASATSISNSRNQPAPCQATHRRSAFHSRYVADERADATDEQEQRHE